jgi:Uncharacterised nucleotidyltransferase
MQVADRVRTLVTGGVDWQTLLQAAGDHGVTPLVCSQVLTHFGELVPTKWRTRMRRSLAECAQRNLYMTGEMFRLASQYRAAGILAVPYKGPLLATQAYGNLAMRQFSDLDFAIRQRDLPRAAALLAVA